MTDSSTVIVALKKLYKSGNWLWWNWRNNLNDSLYATT